MLANPALKATLRTVMDRRPWFMTFAVTGWSIKYLVSLGLTHTTGPEAYGVLVAGLAVAAAFANLAVLRSNRWSLPVVAAILALWAVVALGGLAGTVAHIIGPVAGHGPVDLRPRPIPAPLVFTVLGIVGGAALVLGRRVAARRAGEPGEG